MVSIDFYRKLFQYLNCDLLTIILVAKGTPNVALKPTTTTTQTTTTTPPTSTAPNRPALRPTPTPPTRSGLTTSSTNVESLNNTKSDSNCVRCENNAIAFRCTECNAPYCITCEKEAHFGSTGNHHRYFKFSAKFN